MPSLVPTTYGYFCISESDFFSLFKDYTYMWISAVHVTCCVINIYYYFIWNKDIQFYICIITCYQDRLCYKYEQQTRQKQYSPSTVGSIKNAVQLYAVKLGNIRQNQKFLFSASNLFHLIFRQLTFSPRATVTSM